MSIGHKFLSVLFLLLLIGCSSNDLYKSSYRPSYGTYDDGNAYMSDHEGDPRVLFTKSFDDDLKILTDDNFAVVGKSVFSGPPEDFNEAIKIGKDLKVTHVLLSSNYVYSGTKKARKYVQTRALYPVYNVFNGIPVVGYETMPDLVPIVYNKEVPIFKQQAAYLVKLKN